MFTVIVHIHSLSSQFFHKSRFQLYSTCHDERAAHANHNLAFSFTSPAENQDGWCGDYMEYGPNSIPILIEGAVVNHCSGTTRCANSSYMALDDFN